MNRCQMPRCVQPGNPFFILFSARAVRLDLCPRHSDLVTGPAGLGTPISPVFVTGRGSHTGRLDALYVHENVADYGDVGRLGGPLT